MEVEINSPTKQTDFPLTIVTTVNNPKIYQDNIIESTKEYKDKIEFITLYHNYSASVSLNTGLEIASNNLVMFCHQDIYFKDNWYDILKQHINNLKTIDPTWGVLGFAGTTFDGKMVGTHSGLGMGVSITQVQTLDGSILILKKDNNLKFDENLKFFHMYDIDICLQSYNKGMPVYCINVPINHISYRTTGDGLQESAYYVTKKWKDEFPTICTTIGIY